MRPDDPLGFPLCSIWCFEFKFHQKYDVKGVLHHVADKGNWLEWWAKLVDEAGSISREPILVTKQNAGAPVVWFRRCLWLRLRAANRDLANWPTIRLNIMASDVKVRLHGRKTKTKTVHLPKHSVIGVSLDGFFDSVDPDMVRALVAPQEVT